MQEAGDKFSGTGRKDFWQNRIWVGGLLADTLRAGGFLPPTELGEADTRHEVAIRGARAAEGGRCEPCPAFVVFRGLLCNRIAIRAGPWNPSETFMIPSAPIKQVRRLEDCFSSSLLGTVCAAVHGLIRGTSLHPHRRRTEQYENAPVDRYCKPAENNHWRPEHHAINAPF
jgi:hypothetical protein